MEDILATKNGNLEAALTALLQSQATLVNNQALFQSQMSHAFRDMAEMKKKLDGIENILVKHHETLEALPEAIREKVGFKAK